MIVNLLMKSMKLLFHYSLFHDKTHFLLLALAIFGKMHFLLMSENEFFNEIKRDGITGFMDFIHFASPPA